MSLTSEAQEKTQAQETQEGQEARTTFRPKVFVAGEETIFLGTDADLGEKMIW